MPQTCESDEPYRSAMLMGGSCSDRSLKVAHRRDVSGRHFQQARDKGHGGIMRPVGQLAQVFRLTAALDETFDLWRKQPAG